MKINLEFLQAKNACKEMTGEFKKSWDKEVAPVYAIKRLIKENKLDWANWLIVRCMGYKQYIAYAIYAARQVLDIFEAEYPDDNRPRKAIEAAEKYLKNPQSKNRKVAETGVKATDAAAYASITAAPAYAAYTAGAAYAATVTTYAKAAAAVIYAESAKKGVQLKILRYGIKLLKEK